MKVFGRELTISLNKVAKPPAMKALTVEHAPTRMGSIRDPWGDTSIVSGLTPVKLARTLRAAERGDIKAYLTLAEEMEERDAHYGSVLGTRKRAIGALEPVISPASEDPLAQTIAEAVDEDILSQPAFEDLVDGCLDALGKGYAAVEIIWETGPRAIPAVFKWRDPRHFRFDDDDAETLRLITEAAPLGEDLTPYKWVVHRPRLKAGIPIRGGLARLAAWSFLFKNYATKDWVAFAETYGMPLRLGKYGPEAGDDDKQALLSAVMGIGTDAAAVIPQAMQIEFIQAMSGTASADIFERLGDWTDRQVSKAVLGQTMSTDEGGRGGRAQAEVHGKLRSEIREADAKQLARTINAQVIEPYVKLNFGPQAVYPKCYLPAEDDEDTTAFIDNVVKVVGIGLRVKTSEVYPKLGLTEPDDGDEILIRVPATAAPPVPDPRAPNKAANRSGTDPSDEIDRLVEDALSDWQPVEDTLTLPILELAERSDFAEAFLEGLDALAAGGDDPVFMRRLGEAMFKARVAGG